MCRSVIHGINFLVNPSLWRPGEDRTPLLLDGNRLYITNANRNVVALLDPAGEATDTYLYDPFGNVAHTGTSSNPIQFSSEIFDQETGLVYYNYRYYNPKTGRWTKRDPMGEQGGVNLYAFLGNGPLHRVDELGLKISDFKMKRCEIVILYGHNNKNELQQVKIQKNECSYVALIGCSSYTLQNPSPLPGFDPPNDIIGWYASKDGTKGMGDYIKNAKEMANKAGAYLRECPCKCRKVKIRILRIDP